MDVENLLRRCDHTLLRQDATQSEIKTLCEQGLEFSVASVCIPPSHLAYAREVTDGRLTLCTVIGFPNGYSTARVKAFETQDALALGAGEIDMVINIGLLKDRRYEELMGEILAVRKACEGYVLKVIIETCLLTETEKRDMCRIVSDSGADFIKTSTGFSSGGATAADVSLLRKCCDTGVKIKASGGISSLEDARELVSLGADRLGTSKIVKLAAQMKNRERQSAP